jgi:hypothetical protein
MSSRVIIYIVTAIVGVTVAFLLVRLTKLSGQAKVDTEKKRISEQRLSSLTFVDASLKQNIAAEVNKWIPSER